MAFPPWNSRYGIYGYRPRENRLLLKMNTGLLDTYQTINRKYYAEQRKKINGRTNSGYDNMEGVYIPLLGEVLADRYICVNTLGKGSYGVVINARDIKFDSYVAIKIIRNDKMYTESAIKEFDLLLFIKINGGSKCNIVDAKKHFKWKDHLCIVYELLSNDLYSAICRNKKGIPLQVVRLYANDLLHALSYLKLPEINIIRTDIKPENVMLVNKSSINSRIKLVDFCLAIGKNDRKPDVVQTRFYRAPEVLLGCSYAHAIDMWCLACMLVELYIGLHCTNQHNSLFLFYKMDLVIGKLILLLY